MLDKVSKNAGSKNAKTAASKQRKIQAGVDAKDRREGAKKKESAEQLGARKYPEPPFPRQHHPKPGHEHKIEPAPLYDAPYYIGSKKLDGKVALITGGDSGIGRAVAVLFAREGADIAISSLTENRDAEVTTIKEFGRLDVLVNNAAFQIHSTKFEDLTPEHFDTTLKTNLYGYFHMAQAAVPHMKPGSAIINTGSVTGIDGSKELVDYSMTKGGIHAFTRALSGNLLSRGIRVNAVAPGPVWTPLNPSEKEAGDVSQFGAKTPMKRPAQPEEIAPAYVFLASPHCSSYITGEILPIIGGY
jgi:NAD(P)-dependent dehydrogenase (short-subunit alcohol dehydrogenase family)